MQQYKNHRRAHPNKWTCMDIECEAGCGVVPFRYRDRGTMATIGRNKAAAVAYGRTFTGFPAWFLWLSIHLLYLIGYRNRLLVLINWARHYLFREHAACRILPSEPAAERG